MSYLIGEMAAYLLVAAVIGVLIGWFLNRYKCNKVIVGLESQKQELTSEVHAYKTSLASKEQQLLKTYNLAVQLRSQQALAEGNAHLMESRWQSTLKQARQAPNQLKWIQSLQTKLAAKNTQLSQNCQYAEAIAWKAKATQENLTRVHTRLSEVDAKIASLKDWVSIFRTKLMKTKAEYGQLRNYATAIAKNDKTYKGNLARTHNRLTEIEGKQQPLRTWIRVFQTKLMKTKSEYGQLRSYSENIQTALNASEDSLTRIHTRLSEVTSKLKQLHDRRSNSMPPLPPPVEVNDNRTLRLVDRIRLLGTSKKEVYGRMHNQIREARLETIETERVLTDSCEEKDAIIDDLRVQLRKTENRAQKAPVVQLDQSVKIKELESELAQVQTNTSAQTELKSQIREHQFTIDAYRSKLNTTKNQMYTERLQRPTAANESEPASSSDRDDLKLIKGVGPKIEGLLNDLGIFKFSQIAAWNKSDIEDISTELGSFKNRVARDEWVKKARKLAKQ